MDSKLLKDRRILLADDEVLIATFLMDVIQEAGAVVIGPAFNFADAMKLAETERLDAALLDVNLGGRQSYPVAALLRSRGVRVAFLTGMESGALPVEFAGVVALNKPVPVEKLLATLEGLFS